ncbi:PA0069 family radical SAM protein [Lignipirellula cremea]|uniref:Radical SAM superfamily protein n=1 Tax=Lignipirellula cremea TaxID=2528010 RepID=A0A518DYS1_9BACT|nr:PA0069 family radical SAM protein [Lignipirellula cremea]QDU96989.1 Radical SAM superfamily protein [Lignipirellula cremea]
MRHGSRLDPPNRFETTAREVDLEQMEWDTEYLQERLNRKIDYLDDQAQSVVSENTSPDIPFRYSLNPYRGCVHACSYCYARNTHEYLGYNAGLDFETKILVKQEAASLLRKFLGRKAWQPEMIMFSGVTDCYQPAERQFRITRQCLEVAWECRQPIGIITKNALVLRDLDLLQQLAGENLVNVFLSINSLDPELARRMEPRTSIPAARLRAVQTLAAAGVPVGVMTAPIIPGLNDSEIPALLQAARQAGAQAAGYNFLRLPITVEPVFLEWLQRNYPEKRELIEGRIRSSRDGELSSSTWSERMRGTGQIAEQIQKMFRIFAQKNNLARRLPPLDCTRFRPPETDPQQLKLF